MWMAMASSSITKQLAELMGGKLTLTSEEGKGATFSLVIPAGLDLAQQPLLDRQNVVNLTAAPSQAEAAVEPEFSGHILVAEDARTNQIRIKTLLERVGLQVTIAEDGSEAFQEVMAGEFDLIFMDIMMPHMNGYEATMALRKEGVKTPIVALVANVMKGDDKKCFEVGCDEYLAKLIDRRELLKTIGKYLHQKNVDNSLIECGT